MVRHGFHDAASLTSLLREVVEAKRVVADSAPHTRRSRPDLAAAADASRTAFRQGRQLARRIDAQEVRRDELGPAEVAIYERWTNGDLLNAKREAERAFGHGAGADPRPSIEELAAMAVQVDLYMKQPG